jgi:phenylacetate-coenzyme A ligase PaaK-like adenylate-forming protein
MLETAVAQLLYAYSMITGRRCSLWAVETIARAAQATRHEFGRIGAEGAEMMRGPALDAETGRELQLRRFRVQAQRAARETTYYARLFATLGIQPNRFTWDDLHKLPLTPKGAVRADGDAFVRRSSQPYLRATTTGTTGRPTSICFSSYEIRLYAALGAIHALVNNELCGDDLVQLSTAARGLLGNLTTIGACAHIGAAIFQTGIVDPQLALAELTAAHRIAGKAARVTNLNTYPSYLGILTEAGLACGYGPADFGLREISVGGEIVTAGVQRRCQQLFGNVRISQGFGMTEIWPVSGRQCEEGHLHWEWDQGLIEVVHPESGAPVADGEFGVIVATPFMPFRETTLLLRYNTEDTVRAVHSPACSLNHLPATSNVLGKLGLCVRHARGWTTPRDVMEAVEGIDEIPLPARCAFWAHDDGIAVACLAPHPTSALYRALETALLARGVPLRDLNLVANAVELRNPLPLRGDLREITFDGTAALPRQAPSPVSCWQLDDHEQAG